MKVDKKTVIVNTIILSILLILSVIIVRVYSKDYMNNHIHEGYKNYGFVNKLCTNSYVLYNTAIDDSIDDEVKESYRFTKWQSQLVDDSDNLEYAIFNGKGELVKKYASSDIETLIRASRKEEVRRMYDFFIILSFDKNGNIEIEDCKGVDKREISNLLLKADKKLSGDIKINKVNDVKVVYAISYQSLLNNKGNIDTTVTTIDPNMLFLWIAIAGIVLFALLISHEYMNEIIFTKIIYKIPIEISILLSTIASLYIIDTIKKIASGGFITEIKYIESEDIINTDICNILRCFVIYLIFFVIVSAICEITRKNNIEAIKNKSLIYKFFKWSIRIDFREPVTYRLLILIVINFIVMLLLTINIWTAIVISITYSIILFCIAKKYLDDVKEKYSRILTTTEEISRGNLDVEIDEELGIFEPIKKEIQNIKVGFKRAVEEETKSQVMKTELISNVSHDLKTPLTSIISYIDLLKDEDITEEQRKKYIRTLEVKSNRLKVLIEDLFDMSKANSGNIKLDIVNVDIVDLIKQILIELDDKIKESALIIRKNFPEGRVVLKLDSQYTFRVFENLMINITKYAMRNSRVYIDIFNNIDNVDITLKNMSAEEIDFDGDYITERFVRGDKSRNTEGSGLGLAIAKTFIELQGGKMIITIDGDLFKVNINFPK